MSIDMVWCPAQFMDVSPEGQMWEESSASRRIKQEHVVNSDKHGISGLDERERPSVGLPIETNREGGC